MLPLNYHWLLWKSLDRLLLDLRTDPAGLLGMVFYLYPQPGQHRPRVNVYYCGTLHGEPRWHMTLSSAQISLKPGKVCLDGRT